MKILIYAQHFPPGRGGMEFSNFEIAKGLHNLGHEVEVVTVRNQKAGCFTNQLKFHITLMPKWPFLKSYSLDSSSRANWIFLPVYCHWLKKRIDCFSPDVVFVADEASNCFWGSWAGQMKVPYVSYCSVPFIAVKGTKGNRGLLSDIKFAANNLIERQFKRFNLKSYTSANWICVVSNSTRKEILSLAPWLEKRMDVIPRSIDDSFYDIQYDKNSVLELKQKLGINETDFVLLSVSNLEAGKGVDDVLRALELLRGETSMPLKYIVVGDGRAAGPFKKLAQELGLSHIVTFSGNIPHAELITYYDICNLFVLPSRRGKEESFGRVFVEAAARRKPSIGVNEGGMVDAIVNRKTGFLVKAGAFHEIRDRIVWFLAHSQQAANMGQEARYFAEANFRSAKIAHALADRLKWAAETDSGQVIRSSRTSVAGYTND
jgi:glycosyltransferase involved in cell wall biosynthesis